MTAPPSAFSPQGSTHVAAVIGCPVRHSLSPVLHNAAYRALGLDWVYVAFEVAPGAGRDAIRGMRALDIDGLKDSSKLGKFLPVFQQGIFNIHRGPQGSLIYAGIINLQIDPDW